MQSNSQSNALVFLRIERLTSFPLYNVVEAVNRTRNAVSRIHSPQRLSLFIKHAYTDVPA